MKNLFLLLYLFAFHKSKNTLHNFNLSFYHIPLGVRIGDAQFKKPIAENVLKRRL